MNIAPSDLDVEHARVKQLWPYIHDVEVQYGLPHHTLCAVGSRETNLDPKYANGVAGDGGHGHGMWQEDDRTPGRGAIIARIAGGDVRFAAEVAAGMLQAGLRAYGSLEASFCVYNSGSPRESSTTGGDYGVDTLQRMAYLQRIDPGGSVTPIQTPQPTPEPPPVPPTLEEAEMMSFVDPKNGCPVLCDTKGETFLLDPQGGTTAYPANVRYLGGLTQHPEWHAGGAEANGPVVAIWPRDDGNPGQSAWVIETRDAAGVFHSYAFPSDARLSPSSPARVL